MSERGFGSDAHEGDGAPPVPPPVGQGQPLPPPPPHATATASGERADPRDDHPWLVHVMLIVVVNVAVALSLYVFLLGFVWLAYIVRSTGGRARDLWLLLVPIAGNYVMFRHLWRYTAKVPYWRVRDDLEPTRFVGPGRNLFGVA